MTPRTTHTKRVLAISGLFILLTSSGQGALVNLAEPSNSQLFDPGKIVSNLKNNFAVPTAFAGSGGGGGSGGGSNSDSRSSSSGGDNRNSDNDDQSGDNDNERESNDDDRNNGDNDNEEENDDDNQVCTTTGASGAGNTSCPGQDITPPTIVINSPKDGEIFPLTTKTIEVKATVTDNTDPSPTVTGAGTVTLKNGVNTISVTAKDASGNTWTETVTVKKVTNVTPPPGTTTWKDGTYTGDGVYRFGTGSATITVQLTITSGRLTAVSFISFPTSPAVTAADFDKAFTKMINNQSTIVNTVTGATGTSKAVQDAINNAIAKAGDTPVVPPVLPPKPPVDPKPTVKPLPKIPADWRSIDTGTDSDKDGISDLNELAIGTDPYSADSDNDGNPDKIEILNLFDPLSDAGNPLFSDLMPSHWAKQFIAQLYLNGAAKGYSDGSFRPEQQVNRAEGIKMIVEALALPIETGTIANFSDVSSNDWFYPYVQTATKYGIINTSDKFNPGELLTRAATVKLVIEALGEQKVGGEFVKNPSFGDVDQLAWYANYAEFAKLNGIASGYADGSFGGGNPVTRAQLAKIAYQAKQLKNRTDLIYAPTLTATEVTQIKAERAKAAAAKAAAAAAAKQAAQATAAPAARPTNTINDANSAQAAAAKAAAAREAQAAAARAAAAAAAQKAAQAAAAAQKATTTTNTTTAAS